MVLVQNITKMDKLNMKVNLIMDNIMDLELIIINKHNTQMKLNIKILEIYLLKIGG